MVNPSVLQNCNIFCFCSLVNKELECGPLDDSLTNIQWLDKITSTTEPDPTRKVSNKENLNTPSQGLQVRHCFYVKLLDENTHQYHTHTTLLELD